MSGRLRILAPGVPAAVFFALGNPVPQPRAKVTVRCGFGQAYVPKGHAVHAWRAEVEAACRDAIRETIRGPVAMAIEIAADRPRSHFTRRGALSAAGRAATEPPGDWDNLAKAIQDAMVDAAGIEDDRKACGPNVVWKRWTRHTDGSPTENAGAMVWVAPAELVWCTWGAADDGTRPAEV